MPTVPAAPVLPREVHAGGRTYTRGELATLSSRRRVRTAAARGEIVAVLPGRWASTAHAQSFAVRADAAVKAARGALTGASALFTVGGVDRAPSRITVAADEGRSVARAPWLTVMRSKIHKPSMTWAGFDLVLPAHAILDAWIDPDEGRREGLTLSALQRGLTTTSHVRDAARTRARVRDRAGLERVLAAFDAGAQSFLEHEGLMRVFHGREFAQLLRQHLVIARGRRRYLDMYDPATRTAIELDGGAFHAAGERREDDNRRDADLATLGIQTVRLSYADIMDRPHWCRETVGEILRARQGGRDSPPLTSRFPENDTQAHR